MNPTSCRTVLSLMGLCVAFSSSCGSSAADGTGGTGGATSGNAAGSPTSGTTSPSSGTTNPSSGTTNPSSGTTNPTSSGTTNPSGGGGSTPGSGAFPASSIIYKDVSGDQPDAASAGIIGSFTWSHIGVDFSFVILQADANVAKRSFTGPDNSPDCDSAPVPIPPGGAIEGSNNNNYTCDGGDCHLLVYQGTRLYELYQANISGGNAVGGTFTGTCLDIWDLTKDYWVPNANPYSRGDGCTGSDAADLPLAALMITKEDLQAGVITHALRFTLPNANIRSGVYVHPATHFGGPTGGASKPPYGARFRLRGNYDLGSLPNDAARTIAKALQTYGMFLSDGGNPYISATIDSSDVIASADINAFQVSDFDVVELGTPQSSDCNRTVITQ